MIDIKLLKSNFKEIKAKLESRNDDFTFLDDLLKHENRRVEIIQIVEDKKALRNQQSKQIAVLKKKNQPVDQVLKKLETLKKEIIKLDQQLLECRNKIKEYLLQIPNVPRGTCPIGKDENDNVELRKWGQMPSFSKYKALDHQTLGEKLNILDFVSAAKVSGSRFAIYKNDGAKLHRALTQFLLDFQTQKNQFIEIITPYIVNHNSMQNTGQLPKFANDLFKTDNNMFLIPTAEVSLTNILKDEIINVDKTIKYCSFSPCFRLEAGSAGKDVRGLIRQHQFHKVEMVMFSHPDKSLQDLEIMTNYAEDILKALKLPYRVIELCTGDLGFSSSKTYDIEVWLPSYNAYKEISSCSNMSDFQARRANIRYRNKEKTLSFAHTLNGSGLPIGRTIAAILENNQQEDGSIKVPEVLISYFGKKYIK